MRIDISTYIPGATPVHVCDARVKIVLLIAYSVTLFLVETWWALGVCAVAFAVLLGVSRTVAAEFTFFLAIPVMFGASLLKLVKFGLVFTQTELIILAIGMVTAFVSSMLIIRLLMAFVKKHDFKVFGWYRIILGIAVLAYFMLAR